MVSLGRPEEYWKLKVYVGFGKDLGSRDVTQLRSIYRNEYPTLSEYLALHWSGQAGPGI